MKRPQPAVQVEPDLQRFSRVTLETALAEVPGYASWRDFDPGPQAPVDERYAALPVLTKDTLRHHFPSGFTPRGKNLRQGLFTGEVEFAQTSGSTDDQVTLVFDSRWWEASERSAWQLNSLARQLTSGSPREAVLASPRCVGPGYADEPLSVAERTIGRHLYLNEKINPASWTVEDIERMAEEMNGFAPLLLEADPAYLAPFARRIGARGIKIVQPRLIFLTYSYPSRIYLRQIHRIFAAPLASSYGSTETGHVFMECEAGRLHQNTAHNRVDFQPWLPRFGGPLRGRMLVSVLHNPWFVALRFDIGDVARVDERGPCPCGRNDGMILAAIEGRIKDVLLTPDGRALTVDDLDAVLAEVKELNGWQLDLADSRSACLRLLAEPAGAEKVGRHAREQLRSICGPGVEIETSLEKSLKHESSGKFRFVRAAFPVNHEFLWTTQRK